MKNFNQNEKPKNDVIYIRVSSQEQVSGFSLDNQEKICREFASKNGEEVLGVFREEGESAKTADRTQLKLMMRFCETNRNKIGKLIIYSVNRLSRKTHDYSILKVFFNRIGISVVSATEGFNDDAGGRFFETVLSAIGEFDNDVRAQKTIEGMRARLLKGLWSNGAPWGYINTRDKLDSKIIAPNPEKAPIVKMLFEQYATGKYTFKELASIASKMGVKSRHGLKISKQLVAKIVVNPIYYGMVVVPKFEISLMGSHEPIISEELFRRAQDVRHGIIGRKLPRNKDNQEFPLRGIKCSVCGKSFSGGKTKGKTKYYQYYSCINPDCLKRKSINKDDLEKDFTKFLIDLTPNDEYFEVLKEAIGIAHKIEITSITSLERKLSARITEIKTKKDKLLDLRIEGKISDGDFIPANDKFKIQILELEQELNNLSTPELGLENVVNSGIEFLKHLPENWRGLDVKDLRVLRNLLYPKNLNYSYPSIKTPELCPIYNLKSPINDEKNRLVTLPGIGPGFKA